MNQKEVEIILICVCMLFIAFISIYLLFAILNDIKCNEQCDALGCDLQVKRLGLILAVQAEIEGMKVLNQERESNGYAFAYNEEAFTSKADELRNISYCHEDQL